MKIKWVRFADNYKQLDELLNKQVSKVICIDGKEVLLVKSEGCFYLTALKCPHQGASLKHAVCEEGKLVCPWHRYGFDLKTGRGAGLYLENYPIQEQKDGIYAGFEYFSWFGE